MRKKCECCDNEAINKERFCKDCRKSVLASMRLSGYLEPHPPTPAYKSYEQMENTRETKYGIDR